MEKYADSLNKQAHARYLEKTAFIGNQDPYQIDKKEWSGDHNLFPELTYPDLVNYLIFHPSPFYTLKDFQNYKSLDAYDRFVCGWVRDVGVYIYSANETQRKVIKARVMHSQKLSDPSLHPWIITDDQSKVISAHCDCKAGLGESCSHVASVLFYIEATVRLREATTVTQAPAYWMLPTSRTSVTYSPLSEIDFTSSKTLKKQLDKKINQAQTLENTDPKLATHEKTPVKKPAEIPKSRFDIFFNAIKPDMPSCLSINREYNTAYIPKSLQAKYPLVLTELFDDKCVGMNHNDILDHCQSLIPKVAVTEEEAVNVECETREQADSKHWHRFRTGRITASRMKAACSTSCENPSMSLLKSICYPTECKFSSAATEWGCKHEETARNRYHRETAPNHTNWKSETCGLFLNPVYPHMGASPDGLVECDCCGKGCLEIKCSYCMRDENVRAGKGSCLENTATGLQLKRNHAYFYQVQTQLYLSDADYCDFVMWTREDIFVERIEPCSDIWGDIVDKSTRFFATVVLPELVSKYYSSRPVMKEVTASILNTDSPSTSKGVTSTKKSMKSEKTKKKCQTVKSSTPATSSDHAILDDTDATDDSPSTAKGVKSTKKSGKSRKTKKKCLDRDDLDTTDENLSLYCICDGAKHGRMIACDSPDCPNIPYEWFHFSCMKLKKTPVAKWFCPDCKEINFLKSLKK